MTVNNTVNNKEILTFIGPIQHKRGTAEALAASNYVPAAGELVIATDTGEIRCGNGLDVWRDLPRQNAVETAREAMMSVTVNSQQVRQKYIEMPLTCDTRKMIKLFLQGLIMENGVDWEVKLDDDSGRALIAWEGCGLDGFVCENDKVLISYYEKL